MNFDAHAATAKTAASFSVAVQPCSAIENRSVLYRVSHDRRAPAASAKEPKEERIQNSSLSMRWLRSIFPFYWDAAA
jgi:hypothetical protein